MNCLYQLTVFCLALYGLVNLLTSTPWGLLILGVFLFALFGMITKYMDDIQKGNR